jgi:Zn-dependent oligopeptidase
MKENWAWERDVLRKISRHYQTSEPLPDALIDRMLAAKNAHSGMLNLCAPGGFFIFYKDGSHAWGF